MKFFKKHKEEKLHSDVADQMLKSVFDACEIEPNTVPLDDLVSYSNYRKDRFLLQKIILIVIMLLFLTIPFFFVAPKITSFEQQSGGTGSEPTYDMYVDSFFVITSVTATIDGKNVPVYEKQKHSYSIEPTEGGTMEIVVNCLNQQYISKTVEVSSVDRTVPEIVSDTVKDDYVYIYLKDEDSGLDFDKIYAKDTAGSTIEPAKINEENNYIAFDYPTPSLTVFIPDKAGNVLQLAITSD